MEFLEIILIIVITYYLLKFYLKIWSISEELCIYIQGILEVIAYPLLELWRFIKSKFEKIELRKQRKKTRLFARCPFFGEPQAIWCFLLSSIFIIVVIIIAKFFGDIDSLGEDVVFMYPTFYLISVIIDGASSFSLVSLLSVAFSSLLTGWLYSICMSNYRYRRRFLGWIISFIYYAVTTVTSCILAYFLNNVCNLMSETGISLYENIKSMVSNADLTFIGVCKFIIFGIIFLLFLYIGIILLLIAVKECIEAVCYSFIALLSVGLLVNLANILPPQPTLQIIVNTIIPVIVIIGADFVRVNKNQIFYDDYDFD